MSERAPKLFKRLGIASLVAVAIGVTLLLRTGQTRPEGVVPVAWDKEPCAECRMLVGVPAYAAQVQTTDGSVHNFDDPGCALRWLAKPGRAVHAVYFHHLREDRWLRAEEAVFLTDQKSPMGSGLGAVERSVPSAITREQAAALVARQEPSP